ncbi:caspase domain-containing protein [Lysobacter sp. Hz 25]|uniref:caspase family protein n=1 Tax=Lysobacter sp. Hz 25 TaxID=3383698 RepID=UPI0038D3D884
MSMTRLLCVVLLASASFTIASPALAQSERTHRVALLIGNWDYNMNRKFDNEPSDPFVSDLSNPCRDIERLRPLLEHNRFKIHEYCNSDRAAFERNIDEFSNSTKKLPKGSIVFVYYAGHGIQYLGQAFALPVLIRFDRNTIEQKQTKERLKFFKDNANSIARLLERLNDDDNIALVVALDNCRNSPFGEDSEERVDDEAVYNNAVSIRTRPNTLIQYATTAGDRAGDSSIDNPENSPYAEVLSQEIAKGGDIGDIMSRVDVEIYKRYNSGKLDAYTETNTGPAFSALKHSPDRAFDPFTGLKPSMPAMTAVAVAPSQAAKPAPAASITVVPTARSATPPSTSSASASRHKILVRNIYDGTSLDIIWCEGPGEEERFRYASWIATDIARRAREFEIGRIQIKPLSQLKNEHGRYNVYRNLMRYDIEYPDERKVLRRIAAAYPQSHFLLQRGIGVGGRPLQNYVSAFICERFADNNLAADEPKQ